MILFLNNAVKTTNWYNNVRPPHNYFSTSSLYGKEDSIDLLIVGSSAGIYNFNFNLGERRDSITILNISLQPQTIKRSYDIIKKYHKMIRFGGGLWFVFCPFSGLKVEDENADRNDVFYYILDPLTYEDYDNAKFRREWPLLANTKKSLSRLICDDPPKYNVWDYPLHGKIDFQINAKSFALGWKKEFDIEEFTDSLSLKNLNRLNYTCKILYKIRVMCMQHNIKFTIVIPPLHRFLLQELGESPEAFQSFREVYIDKLIKPLSSDTQVNVLDYLNDSTYSECDSIWASSLFMNKIGAKLFTRQVLADIGILR